MIKALLALLLAFGPWASAEDMPSGGIKGRVLSRVTREAVEHAHVAVLRDAMQVATARTDAKGNFVATGLEDGQYVLSVKAPQLLETRIKVTVSGGRVKNVFNVMLQAVNHVADDAPDALFGSWDVFANLSRYQFPLLRDHARGLPVESQEIYLAGVRMDEVAPLSLVNGLDEAFRLHTAQFGSAFSEEAFGGYNGAVSLDGTASGFRTGFNANLLSHSALYYLRGQAAYATGTLPGGWAVAAEVGAHTPALISQPGHVLAGYVGVDKVWSARHKLSAAVFHTAAPIALVRFDYSPSRRFRVHVTTLGRWSSAGAATLHLAGAFAWHPARYFSFSGGVDGRMGTGSLVGNRRLELWMGGRGTWRRFGLQAGLRAGQEAVGEEIIGYFTPKAGIDYTWGNILISSHSAYFLQEVPGKPRNHFLTSDANVSYNGNTVNVRVTGYLVSLLDPFDYSAGMEVGFKLPVLIIPNVSVQGAVNVSMMGESQPIPQLMAMAGVSWSANAWFVDAGVQDQGKLFSVNLEAGKSWNLQGKYRLGIASGLRNLLLNEKVKDTLPYALPGLHYLMKVYLRM